MGGTGAPSKKKKKQKKAKRPKKTVEEADLISNDDLRAGSEPTIDLNLDVSTEVK